MDRSSLFKLSGLPDSFGVVLLSFSFILLLAPYFSNADFGLFKIPNFTQPAKKWLKILGPVMFLACILSFMPFFPVNNKADSPTPGNLHPESCARVLKSAESEYCSNGSNSTRTCQGPFIRVDLAQLTIGEDCSAKLSFRASAMAHFRAPGHNAPWVFVALLDENGGFLTEFNQIAEASINACGGYEQIVNQVPLGAFPVDLLRRARAITIKVNSGFNRQPCN